MEVGAVIGITASFPGFITILLGAMGVFREFFEIKPRSKPQITRKPKANLTDASIIIAFTTKGGL